MSKIQRTEEKGKTMVGSSKSAAQSIITDYFTSPIREMTYINNFYKKSVLGEIEVSISDLSDPIFVFIEAIF